MNDTLSLIGFLQKTGAQVRIYDMGRRVVKIPSAEFLKFEQTLAPYPFPLQHQAWFGISMLDREVSDEPVVWFLRLPLDEQGKLVQAARDYFIHRLAEVALARQQNQPEEADAFKDNPYTFKPREERMATFHAKLARDLKREQSKYFDHALDYFQGNPGWDQWSFVGYQGIADIAASVQDKKISAILARAIPHLPDQPLGALCHCLENEPLPHDLSSALLERIKRELSASPPDVAVLAALVRGLALSTSNDQKREMAETVLHSNMGSNIEILAALSGRGWEILKQPEIARRFMETLARNDHGQEAFNQCLSDLLSIPGMRPVMIATVRDPGRSDKLAAAFAAMSQAIKTGD